jgi:signal transduction histidine kinase
MDVAMQQMNGFQACGVLKQSRLAGRPTVIFLSATNDKEAIARGFEAGGADYIAKPYEPHEALARIRAHLELRQLQLQLETTNHHLRRANVAKDRVLSVTSHDLRNPLTAIRGVAQFLEQGSLGPVNARQSEALRGISHSADRMLVLVNDLLDITTLDDESIKLNCQNKDLAQVLRLVSWIFSPTAAAKKITLRLDAAESGLWCECDEIRVQRVLENLVSNALKFSSPGSTVTVGARQEGELMRCWVDDEGPGVPVAEQNKLFTDYGRTSIRPTAEESSTGLGLAICRRIVTAHGGAIAMRNRPSAGARFEFCLPLEPGFATRQPATRLARVA